MGNDKVEYIDVSAEGDRILGAEMCSGRPLLFSRKHGVLVLTAAEGISTNVSMCESPMGSPCPSDMYDGNLSLYEIDPNEVSMVTTDACGKLKTAFLFHVRRDAAACRAIVEELFPAKQRDKEQDSALDRTVVRIATELCDDVPQGDPRWKARAGPATNIPLGSSSALQIAAQLRDKQRAFSLFAEFLRAVGLWQRLAPREAPCG
ncbi:nuclear pore complex protein Nup133-like [Choristoneura fumiferana]|uniref:nuclear pore complex protein Nup133-like n=1 Tax=Choristoneura fumiferana TaxID=7141 RepID=UPI003D15D1B6